MRIPFVALQLSTPITSQTPLCSEFFLNLFDDAYPEPLVYDQEMHHCIQAAVSPK